MPSSTPRLFRPFAPPLVLALLFILGWGCALCAYHLGVVGTPVDVVESGPDVVTSTAYVGGDARVSGAAAVSGRARVSGNAKVAESASVSGDAVVSGSATIHGNARVSGDALVLYDATVDGDARVSGTATVSDQALVSGNAQISGRALVAGSASVSGDAVVSGSGAVYGNARVSGAARIERVGDIAWVDRIGEHNPITLHRTETGWQINHANISLEAGTVGEVVAEARAAFAGEYTGSELEVFAAALSYLAASVQERP